MRRGGVYPSLGVISKVELIRIKMNIKIKKWIPIVIGVLAGISFTALISCNKEANNASATGEFTLSSIAVKNGELQDEYKCEKKVNDVESSIPLSWSNVPEGTKSLAITMVHYPNPEDLTHPNSYLLLWGIDPGVTEMPYGTADDGPWYMGSNKDGTAISYTSPCSPTSGSHEYTITIYALSEAPSGLPSASSIDVTYNVLMDAISDVTIIDKATLTFNSVTP